MLLPALNARDNIENVIKSTYIVHLKHVNCMDLLRLI